MNEKFLIWLLGIFILLPATPPAKAGEIHVQTERVRVERSQEGEIFINTGRTQLYLPATPPSRWQPPPICRGYNTVRQESRQVIREGQARQQASISQYLCR